MKVLFLHGWHSVPGGVKPTYLAERGLEVLNPALDDDDFGAAVATAQGEFDKHQPQVVVGSSRGGAVAMNIKSADAWLVLLCPARRNWGTARTVKADTVILHSRADDVIPFADSEELVRTSGLPAWTLVDVGNDHRLADPESLAMLLDACRIKDEEADEEEDLLERDWTGLCYTAVLRWADEEEHRDWVVVHGTVLSEKRGKRSEPYKALFDLRGKNESPVVDSFRTARPKREAEEGTSSGFKAGASKGSRIDWIGVSRDWKVIAAGIDLAERNGRTPSDHFPVTAQIRR